MMASPWQVRWSPGIVAMSALLFLAGAVLMINPTRAVYLPALGVFAAMGIVALLRGLFVGARLTVWDVFMMTLCLGYGLGTLNTELTWIHSDTEYLSVTRASPLYVMQASAWLMLLGSALGLISCLDQHFLFADIRIPPAHRKGVAAFVLLLSGAAVLQIGLGTIGFHQDMTDGGEARVSAFAALTISGICPALAMGAFTLPDVKGWSRRTILAGMGVLMLVQFYQGRRVFIYSLILMLICHFTASKSVNTRSMAKRLLGLLLAGVMIFVASKSFYALRMAMWELGSSRDPIALVKTGVAILKEGDRSGLSKELEANQQSRTFIVGYLAEILEAQQHFQPLYGEVLGFDLAISVPGILWPGKYKVMAYGAEETLANPQFGMQVDDEANSLATTGASDFGIPGIFLYPIGLCALYGWVMRLSRQLGSIIYLSVAVALVNTLLNVEVGTAEYVGTLRSIAISLIGAWGSWRLWCSLHSTAPVEVFEQTRSHARRWQQRIEPVWHGARDGIHFLQAKARRPFSARG